MNVLIIVIKNIILCSLCKTSILRLAVQMCIYPTTLNQKLQFTVTKKALMENDTIKTLVL